MTGMDPVTSWRDVLFLCFLLSECGLDLAGSRAACPALEQACSDGGDKEFAVKTNHSQEIAQEMRTLIESSIAETRALGHAGTKAAGITPFTPTDTDREVSDLGSYENHRFMENWFLSDWGGCGTRSRTLDSSRFSRNEALGVGAQLRPCAKGPNVTAHADQRQIFRCQVMLGKTSTSDRHRHGF
jgi:hypothetical protein